MNLYITNFQEEFSAKLNDLKTAKYIRLVDSEMTLEQYDMVFKEATQVARLQITNHKIKSLPNLKHLDQLNHLDLTCPNIESLPEQNFPSTIWQFNYNAGKLHQLPDYIWKIENLRQIWIKNEEIVEMKIPSGSLIRSVYIITPKLEKLEIGKTQPKLGQLEISSRSLKKIGSSFSNLTELYTLKIKAPIEEVNCDFSQVTGLSEVRLDGWNLEDYDFMNTIQKMYFLEISRSKKKWKNLPDIKQWKNINRLWISDCLDTTLTDSEIEGQSLIQLYIRNSNIKFEPKFFKNCQRLSDVQLENIPPVNFAECVRYLNKSTGHFFCGETELIDFNNIPEGIEADWSYLTLSKNNIEHHDLDFLDHLPKLKLLRTWNNPIYSAHVFLKKRTVPIEKMPETIEGFKYKNVKQFCSLCSSIEKSDLPQEDKEFFVNYLMGRTKLDVNKTWNWETILKATNITLLAFRKKLMALIDEKVEAVKSENPLNQNSIIYISGKPNMKITELKKQVKELGLQLESKYSDKVTHVVIGTKSPDYHFFADKKFTPITDVDLQKQFADSQPQFLKETLEKQEGAAPEMLENLERLLQSSDIINVKVGLEMMKNGGMPPQIFDTLLLVQKTTVDAKIRNAAKDMLEIHADAEWKPLVRDRLSFKMVNNPHKSEVDIRRQFKAIAKKLNPTIAGKFSMMMFQKIGKGLRYSLTAGLKKELKVEAYQLLLTDHHFDFSKGLGFSERPKDPNSYDEYNLPEMSVALPVLALELGEIHSLDLTNCRYNALSQKITKFKDLKHLNLSINEMSSLPDYFDALQNIVTIGLRENKFSVFPEVFGKLPNLKKVDFRNNRNVVVPDWFLKANPDCEVLV
ncbi:MAG: BRCT domain-containing protein [Saprospiraceae bacterium]